MEVIERLYLAEGKIFSSLTHNLVIIILLIIDRFLFSKCVLLVERKAWDSKEELEILLDILLDLSVSQNRLAHS